MVRWALDLLLGLTANQRQRKLVMVRWTLELSVV